MDLSVIIVSFNVKSYLHQALHSVITASAGIKSEIIVIDNCSSDGSAEMVETLFSGVRLIRSDMNNGYAAACNMGIRASSGEFILILNPDTIVSPEAFSLSLKFMNDNPDAGAAGARMTDGKGRFLPESKRGFPSPLTALFRLTGLSFIFRKSAIVNHYYLGNMPEDTNCRADILTGAYMFIRRQALEKVGLFDTAFFMYGEDIDLSHRIVMAGYHNYYLANVRITHFKGMSSGNNNPVCIRYFYEAMIIFSRKYFSGSLLFIILPAIKARMYLALFSAQFRK
ncbi:MAG TPA: glycosyltransferase family 2 protein [Bacteroidales bacterium]|nr:glycosyltransferase family 2 protein [Bacteroidales bacterium]